jgi:hypothetical protein
MRRLLNQLAWAAIRAKGSYFQTLFQRLTVRKGLKLAIWAVARRLLRLIWKILHEKVRYVEHGPAAGNLQGWRPARCVILLFFLSTGRFTPPLC